MSEPPPAIQVVFGFPGQGAQVLGMGRAFLTEGCGAFADTLAIAGELLELDLERIMIRGPVEELNRTEVAQPALFVCCVAMLRELWHAEIRGEAAVGHSLGEYAALVACGALSFEAGLALVKERGQVMSRAARAHPGTMSAVLGLPDDTVSELCDRTDNVWPANFNCPGQVVVSGTLQGVAALEEAAQARGGKVRRLAVSGAFHSPLMEEAAQKFQSALDVTPFKIPRAAYFSTVSAAREEQPNLPQLLRLQITQPVLFSQTLEALDHAGARLFIEIGPGKTLCGLLKRAQPQMGALSFSEPGQLKAVREALAGLQNSDAATTGRRI